MFRSLCNADLVDYVRFGERKCQWVAQSTTGAKDEGNDVAEPESRSFEWGSAWPS